MTTIEFFSRSAEAPVISVYISFIIIRSSICPKLNQDKLQSNNNRSWIMV